MDKRELLVVLARTEEETNKHLIEFVEAAKAINSPLVYWLYDPRKDAPLPARQPIEPAPRKGGQRNRHHIKGNGWKINHEGNV